MQRLSEVEYILKLHFYIYNNHTWPFCLFDLSQFFLHFYYLHEWHVRISAIYFVLPRCHLQNGQVYKVTFLSVLYSHLTFLLIWLIKFCCIFIILHEWHVRISSIYFVLSLIQRPNQLVLFDKSDHVRIDRYRRTWWRTVGSYPVKKSIRQLSGPHLSVNWRRLIGRWSSLSNAKRHRYDCTALCMKANCPVAA